MTLPLAAALICLWATWALAGTFTPAEEETDHPSPPVSAGYEERAEAQVASAFLPPADQEPRDPITVENNTGFPVCEVYLSPTGTEIWVRDYLDGRCLGQGETRILADPPYGLYDLLIISQNGLGRNYYGLDLDTHFHIRLNVASADLFEWDPAEERWEE